MGFPFAGSTVTAKADKQLFGFLQGLISSRLIPIDSRE